MCFTPAIRTCWPFGLMSLAYTLMILLCDGCSVAGLYGLCTKTSRKLYDHVFMIAGRFMLGCGLFFVTWSVIVFAAADKRIRETFNPWENLGEKVCTIEFTILTPHRAVRSHTFLIRQF